MMIVNSIEKYSKINKEHLCKEFYFQSLLNEAYNQAELNDSEIEHIQMQCIKLLSDNIERYTKHKSSSVRVEVGQTIMASNLYTIGICLKSLSDIPLTLDTIKKESISKLYQKGRRIINIKLKVAKHLYQLVRKTKTSCSNNVYNATIDEDISSFFKQYNADYIAHESPISIDYQLFNPIDNFVGIEYMIGYLQNLHMENLFCAKFDMSDINKLMNGSDKDLLVNIYSQVLQNAFGCSILNKDILSLNIDPLDIQELKKIFNGKAKDAIGEYLQNQVNKIFERLDITDILVQTYIYSSLPKFALLIYSAIKNDNLQAIFKAYRIKNLNHGIGFSMGKKMDDRTYRNVVKKILACETLDDKIIIIKKHIKSLIDMEDIIVDSQLSESEILAIFNIIGDVDMAVLVKRHLYHQEIDEINLAGAETLLQRYLKKYIQNMPKDRFEKVQKIVITIR